MQDGTTPTTMLAHWARDRTQGTGQIPIEICVQKQARDTAYIFNLHDRGTPLLTPLRHIPTSAGAESDLRTSWKAVCLTDFSAVGRQARSSRARRRT